MTGRRREEEVGLVDEVGRGGESLLRLEVVGFAFLGGGCERGVVERRAGISTHSKVEARALRGGSCRVETRVEVRCC